MASLSSNLVNNLVKEIHKIKCKLGHDNKKCDTVELKAKIVSDVLNTHTLRMI